MDEVNRRTPLYDRHVAAGGRMVEFAGWEMPVQYTGILQEHRAVREGVGVFDISHMGEFFVSGPGATEWLEYLLTNRVGALEGGEAQYSLMLNDDGGIIDDLIVYRIGTEEYLLIVNAAKISENEAWLDQHPSREVRFENRSEDYGAIAVQGPLAPALFREVTGRSLPDARNRVLELEWPGVRESVYVVTTGYTGEAGFEVVAPSASIGVVWDSVVAAGAIPCGLGARDTLRLEVCYPLNGNDLTSQRSPLKAGLGFFVNFDKGEFIGRDRLLLERDQGVDERLVAIAVEGKAPPIRAHYPVRVDGQVVGETSSGALSPSLGIGIALAYLPAALAKVGQPVEIEVRGKAYPAAIVRKPFYKPT